MFRSILDLSRKETNQVDPVLGICCRRLGPYKVRTSSATTLKKGFSSTGNKHCVNFLLLNMMVEPPMLFPHYKIILETQVNTPVVLHLDPLVTLHVTSRSLD